MLFLESVCKKICIKTYPQCLRTYQTAMSPKTALHQIFLESVKAVQPESLIRNNVQVCGRHLTVKNHTYCLHKPCYMVGFGKAVAGMALALEKQLGAHLQRALVTVPVGLFSEDVPSNIQFVQGAANNLPDQAAMDGAKEIKNLVESLKSDDLLIVLISGGGSALLPLPIAPITLPEKQQLIRDLARRGANITELNTVRKQISLLKGGGLAALAYPARIVALILSDVVGDPLDSIASGPTVPPHPTLPSQALAVIRKYRLYDNLSDSIKSVLRQEKNQFLGNNGSTVTPIANGQYEHVLNFIIGNNKIAAHTAKQHSLTVGHQSVVVSTNVDGNVNEISRIYANVARNILAHMTNASNTDAFEGFFRDLSPVLHISPETVCELMRIDFTRSLCLIFAGEPTVVVTGGGLGGRNQQLALAFGVQMADKGPGGECGDVSFLSCGTDGIDGPTDAAGAIATCDLVADSRRQGLDPVYFLNDNDSYGFFQRYRDGDSLVKMGHTGTNVMDLHLMLIEPRGQ